MNAERKRINHLDVYKGVVILFIIITHFSWSGDEREKYLFPFWIDMAVPVFVVITGYLYAMTAENRNQTLLQAYHPREILAKWARLLIPVIPVYCFQIYIMTQVWDKHLTLRGWFHYFVIEARSGRGSWYIYFMLQVVLLLPILHHIISKKPMIGLAGAFTLNVLYEKFKNLIQMPEEYYRILIFRNLFILAFGIFLYVKRNDTKMLKQPAYYIAGVLGVAYTIFFTYMDFYPTIVNLWPTRGVFNVLFMVPVMMWLVRWDRVHNRFLELLGKASYEIMLVQMIFYWYYSGKLYLRVQGKMPRLLLTVIICAAIGVIYYLIESPVTGFVVKKIRGKRRTGARTEDTAEQTENTVHRSE